MLCCLFVHGNDWIGGGGGFFWLACVWMFACVLNVSVLCVGCLCMRCGVRVCGYVTPSTLAAMGVCWIRLVMDMCLYVCACVLRYLAM